MQNSENYATIFDIQRFSLYDGPGIKTTIFFKGCHPNCIWCQNPESLISKPEIAFYAEKCKESFNCYPVYSQEAINKIGFRIDFYSCTSCGDCVDVCYHDAIRLIG